MAPYFARFNLTPPQFQTLTVINRLKGERITQRRLAREMYVSFPNVTVMLARLEDAGLVQRKPSPDDDRAKFVQLTRRGKNLLQKIWKVHETQLEHVMAGIGSRLRARPVIVGNACYENKMAGIGSREGTVPIIRSNRTHTNVMAGIGSRRGARPVIVDNESHKNNMAGIGVRDKATVAVIIGNRCLENRLVAVGLPDGATAYIHGNELKRTGGGAPPMVALRGGAHAVVSDNLIREGGVAGVLVSGTALISGNRFEGRGPDQQGSAIWVPFGGSFDFNSTVIASNNRCRGYRNLINANKSKVIATDNITREFSGPSLIVKRPSSPARVYGNTAISDNPKDTAVAVDGADDAAASNALKKTSDADEFPSKDLPRWPLLAKHTDGDSFHPLINSAIQRTLHDGPWTLVVTYGKRITYALYNTADDAEEKTDLSNRLEQFTFRLRGLLEQKEGREYQTEMRK